MTGLASFINVLFTLYTLIIIARTFLPLTGISPYHPVAQWIHRLTEPVLAPIRNIVSPSGMIDWSPMIAIIGLIILQQFVLMLILSF